MKIEFETMIDKLPVVKDKDLEMATSEIVAEPMAVARLATYASEQEHLDFVVIDNQDGVEVSFQGYLKKVESSKSGVSAIIQFDPSEHQLASIVSIIRNGNCVSITTSPIQGVLFDGKVPSLPQANA